MINTTLSSSERAARSRLTEDETVSLALNEAQLARRWNVSVKTLRRWRSEHIGPTYCKLGQRTTYLLGDIKAFERRVARNPCSVGSGDRDYA